jgi:hypothetical protein
VGAILALMAFLLAVTMGMASDRFDTRRGMVLSEANAIGTAFLRTGFLPDPAEATSKELLREYTPLRVLTGADPADINARVARSIEIHGELWASAESAIEAVGSSDILALYVEALNEVIDLHESRVTAGIYARVPDTILLLLFGGTVLSIGMVGYGAGLAGRRSLITAVVLVLALGAVLMLVVDLDRARDGLLQVSQQPLIDLQEQIGPPTTS